MTRRKLRDDWGEWDTDARRVVLLVSSAERIYDTLLDLAAALADAGFTVVYVSAVRPCVDVDEKLREMGVDPSSVYFVDAVSEKSRIEEDSDRCVFTKSPELTSLSITLSGAFETAGDKMALILDSITALSIHNQERSVEKFVHGVASKIRLRGAVAVMEVLGTTERVGLERFTMLCNGKLEVE